MRFNELEHGHPILERDQEELNDALPEEAETQSVQEIYEDFASVIVEYGELRIERIGYPFGSGAYYISDGGDGRTYYIDDNEWHFHQFKNLAAAFIEEKGDCRDAETRDNGVMPSGSHEQTCKKCDKSSR